MDFYALYFSEPFYLLLLILLPAWVYYERALQKRGIYFRQGRGIQKIFGNGKRYLYIPLFLRLGILTTFILLFADPRVTREQSEIQPPGIDIAIVLDISKSMLAEDMQPNRMEVAKKTISQFVERQRSDRIGLVIFAGKPFVSIPLTLDYAVIRDAVANLTTDSIEQAIPGLSGTAMGDGILLATEVLTPPPEEPGREKVIILLTDGEANVGVNPRQSAKLASEKSIRIYTVGIGDSKGTELYVTDALGNKRYFQDETGKPILAKVDEVMLSFVAEITGGTYYNATDSESFAKIFQELETLTKRPIENITRTLQLPFYEPFLGMLILLIVLEISVRLQWKIHE